MSEKESKKMEITDERQENDRLSVIIKSQKPWRFYNWNAKKWFCDACTQRIDTDDEHYWCSECEDHHLCLECSKKEDLLHTHDGTDYFIAMNEPNWYHTQRLKEMDNLTVSQVMIDTFLHFSSRYYIGTRANTKEKYSWLTYEQVFDQMIALANGIQALGVKRGDFLGVVGPICVEYILIMWSCLYSGISFVPIQTILSRGEKKYIVEHTKLKIVFCSEEHLTDVSAIREEQPEDRKVMICAFNTPKHESYLSLRQIETMGRDRVKKMNPAFLRKDEIVSVIYTSGTTGFPKGIVFRESGFLLELQRQNFTLPLVVLSFLPYSHISGITDLLLAFYNGGRVALLTGGDMTNLWSDFRVIRPSILSTIPRVLNHVYNQYCQMIAGGEVSAQEARLKLKNAFGDRVTEIVVGSAPCSPQVKQCIRDIIRVPVYDGYGISEVGTVSFDYGKRPECEYRLVDVPELGYYGTDKPYPRGELLVKNALTKNLEYFNNPDMTKKKFDKAGFFHTGDIVELRGEKIKIIDRKNNIVKLAQGEFVQLERIESIVETSKFVDQMVLLPNPGKTKLVGIVVSLSGKVDDGEKEKIFKDVFAIGKENELNPWELPQNLLVVNQKFQLTELKKKARRRIFAQYEKQLQAIFKEDFMQNFSNLLKSMLKRSGGGGGGELDGKKTFVELGGDSLMGTMIVKQMGNVNFVDLMNKPLDEIMTEFSKQNDGDSGPKSQSMVSFGRDDEPITYTKEKIRFEEMLASLTKETKTTENDSDFTVKRGVFLTGASGFIGKYILVELLMNFPKSTTIYCLLRDPKKLNVGSNARIVSIVGDLSQERFGLSESQFRDLQTKVDAIVHCGAMVNHLLGYKEHYSTNVRSLFDILQLSQGVKPIVYTSSASVFEEYPGEITRQVHKNESGYAGSKWVCDAILSECYSNAIVLRLPLVIGSKNSGEINHRDWFNKLIGAIDKYQIAPRNGGGVDTPFDMLSVDLCSYAVVKSLKMKLLGKQINISLKNVNLAQICDFLDQLKKSEEEGRKSEDGLKYLPFHAWAVELEKKCKVDGHPLLPFVRMFKECGTVAGDEYIDFDTAELDSLMKDDARYSNYRNDVVTKEDLKKYLNAMKK